MFFYNLYDYLMSHFKAATIINELYQLSDKDLEHINITRDEIFSIAYDATKNRNY